MIEETPVLQSLVVLLEQQWMRMRRRCNFINRCELETAELRLGEVLSFHTWVLDMYHDYGSEELRIMRDRYQLVRIETSNIGYREVDG